MEPLKEALEFQKWKIEQLHKVLETKERQKFAVLNVSYAIFALLITLLITIILIASKYKDTDVDLTAIVYWSLVLVALGTVIANLIVMRFISGLKCDSLLAMRQLNCSRASVHSILYKIMGGEVAIEGKSVLDTDSIEDTEYYRLIGQHIKLPLDNEQLRKTYFNECGKESKLALYRSSDLFALCAIFAFTLVMVIGAAIATALFTPFIDLNGTFWEGVKSSMIFIIIIVFCLYSGYKIIKSLLYRSLNPLKKT